MNWLNNDRGKAIKIISYLLKELPATHNYKIVFMRRDLNEVLASQAKMLDRRGEPNEIDDATMIELFENDLWKANYLLKKKPQFETLVLHYREVLDEPEKQANSLNEFLGGNYDVQKMAAAVDPTLYRNRAEVLVPEGS